MCSRRLPALEQALSNAGVQAEMHVSRSPDHLVQIVRDLAVETNDTVVAVGGDGTNMAVVDALIRRTGDGELPIVGLVPLGRGNSFARDLPIENIDAAVAAIARQRTRRVDVARFEADGTSGHFLNCLGIGFVTDVARTASRFRMLGDLSYVVGVFHRLASLRKLQLELETDGQKMAGPACFVEICNSKNTGGDMVMAPDAEIDDGLLDVVWVSRISRWTLLKTFPKIFTGQHASNPAVRFLRCRKIRVTAPTGPEELLPDGDVVARTPLTVEVLPQRIRFLN